MKFYIAARSGKKDVVKNIHKKLTSKGYKYLSTWTKVKNLMPYENNVRLSRSLSIKCINAAKKCDVFVLVSDQEGAGMYTELGVAMLSSSLYGKPKIYVIGDHTNRSMFFFHPLVNRLKTIDDVLLDLERKHKK